MGLLKQMDVLLILIAHVCLSKAAERTNEFGKKLPVVPFMVIDNFGMQMCLKECEAFSLCSSINFHRKLFVCELNSHRTDGNISLINDQDYVYHEISHPVRKSYFITFINNVIKNSFIRDQTLTLLLKISNLFCIYMNMTTHVYAMSFSYVKGRFKSLCKCKKNVTHKTKKKNT